MTETKLAEIEGRAGRAVKALEVGGMTGAFLCVQPVATDIPYLLAQVRAMAAALRPFVALAAELEQRKIARASRLWVSEDNDTDLGACDVYDAAAAYAALASSGGTEDGR